MIKSHLLGFLEISPFSRYLSWAYPVVVELRFITQFIIKLMSNGYLYLFAIQGVPEKSTL